MIKGIPSFTLLLMVFLLVSGCSSLDYYRQSIVGHLEVMNKSRPVKEWLQDPATPQELKKRLELIAQARDFSIKVLGLPDNDSYRSYADLKRPYVVWNVFATPEFSFEPVQSCFPFTGCLSYRGYFSRQDANIFAEKLKQKGNDVYVGGIAAYSTLGWFDDPLLNTMMHWQDFDLVGLLFHELAHQQLYVKNDTAFNEAFAMTVELEGLKRWMEKNGRSEQFKQYQLSQKRQQAFIALVLQTRKRLEKLYQLKITDQKKRLRKQDLYRQLRKEYLLYRKKWKFEGYDHWMFGEMNNAKLQSVATYHDLVPAFRKLLQKQQGDFRRFYKVVKQLSRLPYDERHVKLKALMRR